MLLIGQNLNSSQKEIYDVMAKKDMAFLRMLIKAMEEGGAEFIDINTALFYEKEEEISDILCEIVLSETACGVCIDSPDEKLLKKAILKYKNQKLIINSVSLDEKYESLIDLAAEKNCRIIALPIETAGNIEVFANMEKIITKLKKAGIKDENIFLDCLVKAVCTNEKGALDCFENILYVKNNFPRVKTICGLSNISFGLPQREKLNSAFVSMVMSCGLDAALLDTTDKKVIDAVFCANVLLLGDKDCREYLGRFR